MDLIAPEGTADAPSAETLLAWTRPGPRYTSYPTAPVWQEHFPEADWHAMLEATTPPVSVYVHVPFCKEQCTFCGCTMVVAGRREPGQRYLAALERQLQALPLPGQDTVPTVRIHLGGGTPTWFSPDELTRLFALLSTRFALVPGAEVSVEADPDVTTAGHVDALRAAGCTRLSLGVQSFDDRVLEAVHRPQPRAKVGALLRQARGLGMGGLNLDLMYGLPHQDEASFADTLAEVLELRPDRLAVFGYAHLPWLKPHMKRIDASTLPGPLDRARLFLQAHRVLTAAGYQAIGLDHFALPDDELAVAQRARALHRNFMGYTTRADLPLIGLGMSAISELEDGYAQQIAHLSRWWGAVDGGAPTVEKGHRLSADDRLRRDVINALMCNFEVDLAQVGARRGVDAEAALAGALAALGPLEADGLVTRDGPALRVPPRGRLLVRNVAMAFDAHLGPPTPGRPRFSSTV